MTSRHDDDGATAMILWLVIPLQIITALAVFYLTFLAWWNFGVVIALLMLTAGWAVLGGVAHLVAMVILTPLVMVAQRRTRRRQITTEESGTGASP